MPATPFFARGSLRCMGLFSMFLFGRDRRGGQEIEFPSQLIQNA
jgi:hypothetical protein